MLDGDFHHYYTTTPKIGWNKPIWNSDLLDVDAHLRSDIFDLKAPQNGPSWDPTNQSLLNNSLSNDPSATDAITQIRRNRSIPAWDDLALSSLESNTAPRDKTLVTRPKYFR